MVEGKNSALDPSEEKILKESMEKNKELLRRLAEK